MKPLVMFFFGRFRSLRSFVVNSVLSVPSLPPISERGGLPKLREPWVADRARVFDVDLGLAFGQELREATSPFLQRLLASAARLLGPQL